MGYSLLIMICLLTWRASSSLASLGKTCLLALMVHIFFSRYPYKSYIFIIFLSLKILNTLNTSRFDGLFNSNSKLESSHVSKSFLRKQLFGQTRPFVFLSNLSEISAVSRSRCLPGYTQQPPTPCHSAMK